jgi:hypothetical protein
MGLSEKIMKFPESGRGSDMIVWVAGGESIMSHDKADEPVKRKAAECAWYLLATLYGVPERGDLELQTRNRVAWNRLMAAQLDDTVISALHANGHPADELKSLSSQELSGVREAFDQRNDAGSQVSFPDLGNSLVIDFSNLEFEKPFLTQGFLFVGAVYLSGAKFTKGASFKRATFGGDLHCIGATFKVDCDFECATFNGMAYFDSAAVDLAKFTGATFNEAGYFQRTDFNGVADFGLVTFNSYVNFEVKIFNFDVNFYCATFHDDASFKGATFNEAAEFYGAIFNDRTNFEKAAFRNEAGFVNATFKDESSFRAATFNKCPPRFFGATLHEGTSWDRVGWPPNPSTAKDAEKFVHAYERLKLEMDRLRKHEDELNFFALEMQSRRVRDGILKGLPIALYGVLCDFGRNYVRPIYGLLITILIGFFFFWPHFHVAGWDKGIALSSANTFAIFGFLKEFAPGSLAGLPDLLIGVSAVQTVVGTILLFLLGLAVRNRFRMK